MSSDHQISYDMSINDFLKVAASSAHVPGGGNVSAVVATLGASMGAMVASLTKGKKGYEDYQTENEAILKAFLDGIEALKVMTLADIEAFDTYMATFKLPKDTDEQKKARTDAIQAAGQKATLAPLNVCRKCLELMKEAAKLAPFGNKGAISDCGVSAIILEAAIRAAMLSVDINLPSIKDQGFVEKVKAERALIFTEAEELKVTIIHHMRTRW
ncbi:MAG: cyclodeaminase/cyclohydrolase family protein [Deltaproteobacteria bacterium]|jgi:formiminotetrahydrofolate cyclodeaminase|nr:cyclodeaminase/cyclohydrolase family protein [Deltaproteobacteria bacterium]